MHNAGRFGVLALLTVACGAVGQGNAPPSTASPQAVPPPSAFSHPGFVYYNAQRPVPVPPRMPPAMVRVDTMNLAHLKVAAAQASRCNVPKEVADGVFVHVDCYPYKRVGIAVKHATPLKINLLRSRGARWQRAADNGGAPNSTLASSTLTSDGDRVGTTSGFLVAAAVAPLPDMVDHRLNGTEGQIKDQGDVGACTAFALSSVMDNSLRRANLNITTSPEHVWAHYATPTMEDAASGNLNKGITTNDALPYSGKEACELTHDTTDDCGETYGVLPNTAPADQSLEQRLRTADQANGHRVISYEELDISPPNIDEIVTTLASGADIWAAFNIDSSVWVNRRMQNFVIPDWSQPDGGHAIDLAGYRKVNGGYQFLIHNSWGQTWGDGGYAWISQAMVQKWLHLAYKVRTDVDPGSPTSPVPAQTDEDCPGDQVLDTVTNRCTGVCPDQSRPANGQCPNGPAPPPQALPLPFLPGFAGIPGIPAIPGFSIPGFPLAPAAPAPSSAASAHGPQAPPPAQAPFQWPWPVPSGIPNFFPPPPAAPQK